MSKIFDLINELCPYGVEFRELGEICEFNRGKFLSKSDKDLGDIPMILYGELYTTYGDYISRIISCTSMERAQKASVATFGDILLPISSTTKEAQIGKASARKSVKHLGYVRRWQYLCNVVSTAVVH